ncbi:MAG: hypothetical protein V7L25_10270 [Nostoc sp.]
MGKHRGTVHRWLADYRQGVSKQLLSLEQVQVEAQLYQIGQYQV